MGVICLVDAHGSRNLRLVVQDALDILDGINIAWKFHAVLQVTGSDSGTVLKSIQLEQILRIGARRAGCEHGAGLVTGRGCVPRREDATQARRHAVITNKTSGERTCDFTGAMAHDGGELNPGCREQPDQDDLRSPAQHRGCEDCALTKSRPSPSSFSSSVQDRR